MRARAAVLADRFEQANDELIAFVEGCSDTDWSARSEALGWSVAITAHHVAVRYPILTYLADVIAAGQPRPEMTVETIDRMNREHAEQYARCTRGETLGLLRRNAAASASTLRRLTDEQLDHTAILAWHGGRRTSARDVIEALVIGHIFEHLAHMRGAVAQRRSEASCS